MGLFDIFKGKETGQPSPQNSTSAKGHAAKLGRYSDCNKTEQQLGHWDRSVSLRKEGKHVDSFRELLEYIKDPVLNNLSYTENSGEINFTFKQGSKIISGRCNSDEVSAECRIATFDSPSVPVMRKLATLNYGLKYSWFAIRDNSFLIRTRGIHADSSPTKFYWAMREAAINADKQDDLIVEEFSTTHQVDSNDLPEIPAEIKQAKLEYLHKLIDTTLDKIKPLDPSRNNGYISYLLLALNMKIDYLLAPEGVLTDKLEKIQGIYNQKDKDYIQKNNEMSEAFREIRSLPPETVYKSFYDTISTFSIVAPASFKQVADFVFNEAKSKDYYLENRNYDGVITVFEYIAAYIFFNYGLPTPVRQITDLFMHIFNNDYYNRIGYSEKFRDNNGALNKNAITNAIQKILNQNRSKYPNIQFRAQQLDFSSDHRFAVTFFTEFDYLNI